MAARMLHDGQWIALYQAPRPTEGRMPDLAGADWDAWSSPRPEVTWLRLPVIVAGFALASVAIGAVRLVRWVL